MDYSDIVFSIYDDSDLLYIYILLYLIRSAFYVFCKKGGGGGELRFSVLLRPEFFMFSDQ